MTESTTPVPANPSSNIILPTAPEKTNPVGLPAAESIILVPFAPNARFLLKTVLTDVPDTTPATVVPPASPTPTVTFPPNPAATDALLTTPALNARLVKPTRTAARPRFLVLTVVQAATPAASVLPVRVTRTVTSVPSPVTTVALRPTPAESAHPVNPVHRQQTRQAVPTVRNPALTAAAVPDCAVKVIPTATAVRQDTRQPIPGEVRLKRRPRPVLVVLLREPVTKPRRIPTATAVPAGIVKLKLQEVAKQHLNVVLVVQLLELVIENLFVQMLEPLIEIIQPQYVHYL